MPKTSKTRDFRRPAAGSPGALHPHHHRLSSRTEQRLLIIMVSGNPSSDSNTSSGLSSVPASGEGSAEPTSSEGTPEPEEHLYSDRASWLRFPEGQAYVILVNGTHRYYFVFGGTTPFQPTEADLNKKGVERFLMQVFDLTLDDLPEKPAFRCNYFYVAKDGGVLKCIDGNMETESRSDTLGYSPPECIGKAFEHTDKLGVMPNCAYVVCAGYQVLYNNMPEEGVPNLTLSMGVRLPKKDVTAGDKTRQNHGPDGAMPSSSDEVGNRNNGPSRSRRRPGNAGRKRRRLNDPTATQA
ncbi:hypothetical protein [Rhizobium terrae]|uniref:hypothetical protein n=1 Tax=Rhizobium terrae TaxID=2171756 RepID=UPI0013C30FCA|nr:hypothetical protein [Rhizobium terrae]